MTKDFTHLRGLCIDPGVAGDGNACAAFDGYELADVWFERAPRGSRMFHVVRQMFDLVVVERPEYQGARTDNARGKDVIDLPWEGALLAGVYAGRDGCHIIEMPPSKWKGSEPKPINHDRLWEVLSKRERKVLGGDSTYAAIQAALEKGALKRWKISGAACYPKRFTTHNLLDATAIYCVHLGRLENLQ